ncbi:hypothetical protein C882_0221 [Caenispirillum salinarum AK4]|uniref:Cytochrome b561 bacterial/Ni-hydrogenase domain-containing protein n=1 Tax=Caenispirillum salinarum AK4 TaxID=1238182 RepID=K9HMM6_9PROT|nr:cytochrome b/b6 domain-containing protein [Caenispirillum salinarum]EKV29791.1 hypothetical protein C882_0221 [Caenispirillum salinarum AK4]
MTDAPRRRRRFAMPAMKAWHAVVAGGFLVAYLTGDSDDVYIMHQVAGYTVLGALVLRLAVAPFAHKPPWRMPRASLAAGREWLTTRCGRNPLFAWLAVALFATVGAAAASGMAAHWLLWVEDLHEALSTASLWVVLGHVAFILLMFGGRRRVAALWRRFVDGHSTRLKESS